MSRVTVYNDSQCSRVRVSYPTSVIITNVCVHGVNKHLHDVKATVMPSFHCLSPCSYVLEGYFIQEELKTITISVYRCELTSNGQRQHFSSTKIKECKINDRGKINDAAGLCKEEDCIHSPAFTNWLASGCVINAACKILQTFAWAWMLTLVVIYQLFKVPAARLSDWPKSCGAEAAIRCKPLERKHTVKGVVTGGRTVTERSWDHDGCEGAQLDLIYKYQQKAPP